MMVAIGVFVIVTAAVFLLARGQIRARKQTQYLLDTEQNARVALDSLRTDLQTSGLGIGYSAGGVFLGIQLGPFGAGAAFDSNDFVHAGGQRSDDVRLRGATGPARTIAAYDAPAASGTLEVCAGGGFTASDVVLLVSQSYADARAVEVTNVTAAACSDGQCVGAGGCEQVDYVDASGTFESDPSARFANYLGGTAFRGYYDATYFVQWNGATPGLYRAEGACASRAACATAANLLGEGVESLQVRVLEEDPASATPVDQTANPTYRSALAGGITTENRVRVDVEIIARSRTEEPETPPSRLCSVLAPAECYPLGGGTDHFRRRKLQTSVALKNSGHMRFQALR